MSVLEKHIENKVVAWAKRAGFLTPKVRFAERGWPDRLFISPKGRHIYIEFKRPGGKLDAIQGFRIIELDKRGIIAIVCDTYDDAVNWLRTVLVSEALPEKSHQPLVGAGVRGAILGSRLGENKYLSGYLPHPQEQGASEERAGDSPAPSSVQGLAGRDTEVGGVSGADLSDPARQGEGTP